MIPTKYITTINIQLICIFLLISCKEHKSNKKEEKHPHKEEVLLTQSQFDILDIKIDTLKKRNIRKTVEVNGVLNVLPQNKASITSPIGANIVSINVIEGQNVKKGNILGYISHPDIIKYKQII